MGGNRSALRKLTHARGEHSDSPQTGFCQHRESSQLKCGKISHKKAESVWPHCGKHQECWVFDIVDTEDPTEISQRVGSVSSNDNGLIDKILSIHSFNLKCCINLNRHKDFMKKAVIGGIRKTLHIWALYVLFFYCVIVMLQFVIEQLLFLIEINQLFCSFNDHIGEGYYVRWWRFWEVNRRKKQKVFPRP